MGNNSIPRKDGSLVAWALNFTQCVKAGAAVLKLDSRKVKDLETLTAGFKDAVEKTASPGRTHMDTFSKNGLRAELRKSIRAMISGGLDRNPALTPGMREEMALPPERTGRRKAEKPAEKPDLKLDPSEARMTVRCRDGETGRRSRPEGVRGMMFRWGVLESPPESPSDLPETVSKTSGPLVLDFEKGQRGKAFYIAARWENTVGEPGPWSAIGSLYIP